MAKKTETKAKVYNKEDLATKIAEVKDISKAEASRSIDNTMAGLEAMAEVMQPEEKLQLVGYLTMELRHKEAHTAKNPRTKEDVKVPAKNQVKFKAGSNIVNSAQ